MAQSKEDKELMKSYVEYERALVPSNRDARRGATEGPLAQLIPVFLDFEMFMTDEIKLGVMTLRQYLAASHLTAISLAVGYDEPEAYLLPNGVFTPDIADIPEVLRELARDPQYVFVAHNAAFDMRVLRFLVGTEWPKNVWCSMEGSMGAWPELPGGYGLDNLGKRLNFPKMLRKMEIDLQACSDDELLEYNKRDVRAMQELYARQIALLPAQEQEVALRTHRQRQFSFKVSQEKLVILIEEMSRLAEYAENEAKQYLGDPADLGEIFNRDSGELRSIRSKRLLNIINDKMGAGFTSTSLKKISPLQLAQHKQVSDLLQQTSAANKMLSHHRRSHIFINVEEVDIELGYMRAHTGRFSSPSVGKGLNLHNVPKHNPLVAKPIRSVFRLPDDKCFVRADLSNVEYRVEGRLFGCKTVSDMFDESKGGNVFNDPYCLAWKSMVGQSITKKEPIRQVAKAAVLGLGFCLAEDTPVPTRNWSGDIRIKPIQDVTAKERIWNGTKWVKSGGAIATGRKQCICLGNTWLTEDHEVWWNGWYTAAELASIADVLFGKVKWTNSSLWYLRSYRAGTPTKGRPTCLRFYTGTSGSGDAAVKLSDSSRLPLRTPTGELVREERDVYDILDVEEGHRFQAGDWLVHNCMGPTGYARGSLLTALADKKSGVTEEMLLKIAETLNWQNPPNDGVKRVIAALGCSHIVALCAYHIHRVFNTAHPEFSITADWLVSVVNAVASVYTRSEGQRIIEQAYEGTRAPDRNLVGLEIDDDNTFERCSIRVRCGPWPRTVCWRNPKVRPTTFADGVGDRKLTILKANGKFKPFTRQLASENVVQAAARNGLCWCVAELEKEGFPNVLHVHDEMLIITDRNPRAVLAAKEALIKVAGPKSAHPLGWAVMIKPSEINVSSSMWEEEEIERWVKIEKGEPGCLDNLT